MALIAGDDWCWYLDRNGYLAIELGDRWCFRTPYRRRQLIPHFVNLQRQLMTVSQAATYERLAQRIHQQLPDYSDAQVTQAALNATAVRSLLRMEANKSWQFLRAEQAVTETVAAGQPDELDGMICRIYTPHDSGLVLVLQADEQAACAVLMQELVVSENLRPLASFAPLRINLDRLCRYVSPVQAFSDLPLRAVG